MSSRFLCINTTEAPEEKLSIEDIPSPVPPELLHTNHVPTPSETREIQDFISSLEDKLSSMKNEKGSQASNLRFALQSRIEEHRLLISSSPCRTLPWEIISTIFDMSIPVFGTHPTYPRSEEAPLIFCQVCSRWRKIAVSTPSLWRSLVLSVGPRNASRKTQLLRTWFERSGALSLSLSVNCESSCNDQDLLEVVDAIYSFAPQLRALSFMSQPLRSSSMQRRDPPHFPLLTNFTLKVFRLASSQFRSESSIPIRTSPQSISALKRLTLHGVHVDLLPHLYNLSHLTKLALTGSEHDAYSANDCLVILSHCSQLTHFTLTRMKTDNIISPAVTVPCLIQLYITVCDEGWLFVAEFFAKLTFPCLEYINVRPIESEWPLASRAWTANSFPEFVACVGRSKHSLIVNVSDRYPQFRDERWAYLPSRYSRDQVNSTVWSDNF